MKPSYSKRTVDEAVQLLDVYASQERGAGWMPLVSVGHALGVQRSSRTLAYKARGLPCANLEKTREDALEAAQRLREGWRP